MKHLLCILLATLLSLPALGAGVTPISNARLSGTTVNTGVIQGGTIHATDALTSGTATFAFTSGSSQHADSAEFATTSGISAGLWDAEQLTSYTASSFATAAQGTLAQAALPATGGTASNLTVLSGSVPVSVMTGMQLPQYALWRTFDALQRITAGEAILCPIVMTGDSVAYYEISPIVAELQATIGNGGIILNTPLVTSGSATVLSSRFDLTPMGSACALTGSGSIAQFSSSISGTPVDTLADTMAVYFVADAATPGTNTFKLQSNLAGAGWVDENVNVTSGTTTFATGTATVNCSLGSVIGAVATIPKKSWEGKYKFRVVQLSGSSTLLCAKMVVARTGGVVPAFFALGGSNLSQASTVSTAIWSPVIKDIAPKLISCKQYDGVALASFLTAWQALWEDSAPNAEWIYIGTAPVQNAPTDTDLIGQDALYKAHALSHGFCWWSPRTALPSAAEIDALGWNADGTHLTAACQSYTSAHMSRDLGFRQVVGGIGSVFGRIATGNPNYPTYGLTQSALELVVRFENPIGASRLSLTGSANLCSIISRTDGSWDINHDSSGQIVSRRTDNTYWIGNSSNKYRFESKDGRVKCISLRVDSEGLGCVSGSNTKLHSITLVSGSATQANAAITGSSNVFFTLPQALVSGTPTFAPRYTVTTGTLSVVAGPDDNSTYRYFVVEAQ